MKIFLAIILGLFFLTPDTQAAVDTLKVLEEGAAILRDKPSEVKDWAQSDASGINMIIDAANSKGSRKTSAAFTTVGGILGIISGFAVSAAAGDCQDTGGGVNCNNPGGMVIAIGGGVALAVGVGMFFSDTDEVKKLRFAYNSYVMEKRLR